MLPLNQVHNTIVVVVEVFAVAVASYYYHDHSIKILKDFSYRCLLHLIIISPPLLPRVIHII